MKESNTHFKVDTESKFEEFKIENIDKYMPYP